MANFTVETATDVASIYERYRKPLFAYCRQRFDERLYPTDDLAQEAFARFIANYTNVAANIEKPLGLLIRIATNIYLNRRRELRMGTGDPIVVDQLRDEEGMIVDEGLHERLVHNIAGERLARLIESLPDDSRRTLDAYLQDRTYDDIATERGVSRNKVQKDLQRALDAVVQRYDLDRRLDPKIFRRTVDYGSNREAYLAAVTALMKQIDIVLDEGPDGPRATNQELLAENEARQRRLVNWCAARATSEPLAANVLFSYGAARTFMLRIDDWDVDLATSLKPYIRAAAGFVSGREDKWKVLPLDTIVSSLTGDLPATKAAVLVAMTHPPQTVSLGAYHHEYVEGIAKSLPASDQIDILERLLNVRRPELGWLEWLTELYLDMGAADLAETVLEEFERQPMTFARSSFSVLPPDVAYDDSTERWKDRVRSKIAAMRGEFALAEQFSTVSVQRLKAEYDHLPQWPQEELVIMRRSLRHYSPSGPSSWDVHSGRLYAALNEPATAVRHFTYALETIDAMQKSDPRIDYIGPSTRSHGWALYWRARARRSVGDLAGGFADAEAALHILQSHGREDVRKATNLVCLLEYERDVIGSTLT